MDNAEAHSAEKNQIRQGRAWAYATFAISCWIYARGENLPRLV